MCARAILSFVQHWVRLLQPLGHVVRIQNSTHGCLQVSNIYVWFGAAAVAAAAALHIHAYVPTECIKVIVNSWRVIAGSKLATSNHMISPLSTAMTAALTASTSA